MKRFWNLFLPLLVLSLGKFNAQDLHITPIATFKEICSNCHSNSEIAYGHILQKYGNADLKLIVEDMMFGNSGLIPNEMEINVMVAYMISIRDKLPFAVVINSESYKNGESHNIILEVSDRAKIADTLSQYNVTSKESNKIFIQPLKEEFCISINNDKKGARIKFPKELWTQPK